MKNTGYYLFSLNRQSNDNAMLTKEYIEKYFLTEKNDGLVLIIAGALAVAVAIFLLVKGQENFSRGVAVILIISAIWQMIIGYPGFMHSDAHRIEMVYAYDMNPAQLKNEELPRMVNKVKGIRIYRWIEVMLFLTGVLLIALYFSREDKALWLGIGVGLTLQAMVLFIMDLYAGRRADEYLFYLKTFVAR